MLGAPVASASSTTSLHGGSRQEGWRGSASPTLFDLNSRDWIFKTLEPVSSELCLQLRRQLPPPHTSCRPEAFLVLLPSVFRNPPLPPDPFGILLFVGCEFGPVLDFWVWDMRGVFFLFYLKSTFFFFFNLPHPDPVCVSSCGGQI